MSILTCEQLSQCNSPFHSLSSNHPVCIAYVTKRRETLGTSLDEKEKKKHLRGPFCHLNWIFSVKPLANFRKNSPFLSNFFWQFSSESSLLKWPLLQSHLNFRHIYHFRCCVNVCTHLDTLGKNTCTFTWATYPAPPYVVSLAHKGYPPSWVLFWYRHGMSSHDILVAYFVMFHPGV